LTNKEKAIRTWEVIQRRKMKKGLEKEEDNISYGIINDKEYLGE